MQWGFAQVQIFRFIMKEKEKRILLLGHLGARVVARFCLRHFLTVCSISSALQFCSLQHSHKFPDSVTRAK
jgi:hypothetical protein